MVLAWKLQKNVEEIILLESERVRLETQLFYDPALQQRGREKTVTAMQRKNRRIYGAAVETLERMFRQ